MCQKCPPALVDTNWPPDLDTPSPLVASSPASNGWITCAAHLFLLGDGKWLKKNSAGNNADFTQIEVSCDFSHHPSLGYLSDCQPFEPKKAYLRRVQSQGLRANKSSTEAVHLCIWRNFKVKEMIRWILGNGSIAPCNGKRLGRPGGKILSFYLFWGQYTLYMCMYIYIPHDCMSVWLYACNVMLCNAMQRNAMQCNVRTYACVYVCVYVYVRMYICI